MPLLYQSANIEKETLEKLIDLAAARYSEN